MRPALVLPLVLAVLLFAACAGPRPTDDRPVAEDPVCLYYGDLPCVRVHVDASTPRTTYKGVTYYFCAEDCREKFERDPERFIAK
ncbi:MAG TPA: YHS domain-containing protein [Planctomycetota bacterium]|nr:YHS domain-containing protein [Planctomycetota bacterium]